MNFLNNTKITLAFILFCTCIAFMPVLQNGFVNWDDPAYVLQNPFVLNLTIPTLIKSFQTSVEHTYVPLSTLSLAIDHALFGFNPVVFHLNNLLIHLINIILVYLLAIQLGIEKKGAALGALLFALHPLQVEAVAWVTERKGLLCSVFYLLAMRFYIFYIEKNKTKDYVWAVIAGLFSMLAKPMGCSFPVVFLLLDWYLKRRFETKLLVEKIIPFFIVVGLSYLTFSNSFLSTPYPIHEIKLIWMWVVTFYLFKFLLPIQLSPLYDLPQPISFSNPVYVVSVISVLIFCWIIFWLRRERFFIFAVLFFLVVIGVLIIRTGWAFGNFTVVADRFMYLPMIGFSLFMGNTLIKLYEKIRDFNYQKLFRWLIILIFINLGILTFKQTQVWKNDFSLWTHALKVNPKQSLAYVIQADYYLEKHDFIAAKEKLEKAIYFNPQNFMAYYLLAIVEFQQGNISESLTAFHKSQTLNAEFKDLYLNRGKVYLKIGKLDEALFDFNKHLQLAPQSFNGYNFRGIILNVMGKNDVALQSFNKALDINPNFVEGLTSRGTFFATQKNYEAALKDFNRALRLDPKNLSAKRNRDQILKSLNVKDDSKITIFDVGYADAILYRVSEDFNILVDGGDKSSADKIFRNLSAQGISRIQLGVITHPHKNHFGGYFDLIDQIVFDRIIINGDMNNYDGYLELIEKIKMKNIPLVTVKRGDSVENLPAGLTIRILHPNALESTTNGNSLAMLLDDHGKKIFLTADIEPQQQDEIIQHFPEVLEADLIQIPHHGGEISEMFRQSFKDKRCFISTGVNQYGLPKIDQFKQFTGKMRRTDVEGDLKIDF